MKLNEKFDRLQDNYLFAEIENRTSAYTAAHPDAHLIRLGIGDVTLPLCDAVVRAGQKACAEQGCAETFRGYGPYRGYGFLTQKIADYYKTLGADVDESEVFVSDGAKSDAGNFPELFSEDNTVIIPDPVYPVYLDVNVMAGRNVIYADANRDNGFLPMPDRGVKADIIYMCSPNNPTGAAYNKAQLAEWVAYAREIGAIILYDAAYEFFITEKDLPRTIYAVEGADECAVEFCSLSKTAGFTGTRCGYTVVPHKLLGGKLNKMWLRRQSTKFNGVSYVVQRMAEAVFTSEGQKQIARSVDVYRQNALIISDALTKKGIWHTGGVNSPYIWLKCPGKSWDFFDLLLCEANVVGTPGAGFGKCGEGFFRLTAFNDKQNTTLAMQRIIKVL